MFSKKKNPKRSKIKNVNFEMPPIFSSNESVTFEETVPGFFFGSSSSIGQLYRNPLPWQSYKQEAPSHDDIDKIITPSDRFENLLADDCNERTPDLFMPVDTHHFDEEDYRNHRHRAYPHMHQPLKSMEPRVLRKIKDKIRENKKAQLKAATAGVPTSVPQLLASATDSRVIIDPATDKGIVSGPVLSLVKVEGDAVKVDNTATTIASESKLTEPVRIRRKKKRKKRLKKSEPFQPTLCKLSEESSSPLNSANERETFVADLDEFDDEFEDEGDETIQDNEGIVLEELCSILNANKALADVAMEAHDIQTTEETQMKNISFLDEISSSDEPVGFLDMTSQSKTPRKQSLPTLDFLEISEKADNIIFNKSTVELNEQERKLVKDEQPCIINFCQDCETPIGQTFQDPAYFIKNVGELKSNGANSISLSSATHLGEDFHQPVLTQVSSTSALIDESYNKVATCNFHIGSTDSVLSSEQNLCCAVPTQPFSRTASQPIDFSSFRTRKPNHHSHHHHHKEHFTKKDLEKRTFSGQDMRSLWQCKESDDIDEYHSMLSDAVIDNMRSHRCYDMPALHRTRIKNKYIHSNAKRRNIQRSRSVSHTQSPKRETNNSTTEKLKKCATCVDEEYTFRDYSKCQEDLIFQSNVSNLHSNDKIMPEDNPLPLFVEMDILKPHKYWREVSRWVKYEQCYNEFSDTFGRAHSSPLKFTAFTQFRIQMEDALFMPQVEAKTFTDAINVLVEELLVAQLFNEPRDSLYVKEVFRWKYIHAGEKVIADSEEINVVQSQIVSPNCDWDSGFIASADALDVNLRFINTTPGNLNIASNAFLPHQMSNVKTTPNKYVDSAPKYGQQSSVPSMIKMLKNSIPSRKHIKYKSDLEGHLPPSTEGVMVQVGEIHSLKKPFLSIMRFKKPLFVDRRTEIDLPVRFMVVCLGPPGKLQYEEIGRVISTMMIDGDFRKMMYQATDKYEIINGLYRYLDSCFVLSYSGSHPAKNMHTMVEHINDFIRNPLNVSPRHLASKESDRFKLTASVAKPDELLSQVMKTVDSKIICDPEIGADYFDKVPYLKLKRESDSDNVTQTDVKSDTIATHVSFSKVPDFIDTDYLKKRGPSQLDSGTCYRLMYFLFRLLRIDFIKYRQRFISDFKDAFKRENIVIVLCGMLYLYFVCLSPALTFGALLGELVSDEFNVQMILAGNGCQLIIFSLFGGNPLLVVGITGPMFLMETVIGKMASNFNLPILLYRFLVSVYVAVIGLFSLAFNITWIMQKVRRSVEECFNGFVALYFIFKALFTIIKIFSFPEPVFNFTIPKNSTVYDQNAYLFKNRISIGFASFVLAYTMYQICMALNSVKRGRLFTRKIRKMVDYFNVAIGIVLLSFINLVIVNVLGINLPTLKAEFRHASWAKLPPLGELKQPIPGVAHIVAFLLAFALLSLIFTETAISGITVTKTEKKLVKSSLYAQDQFLCLCFIPLTSGCFGWPFISGAAVRSTSHVIAMTKWDQKVIPGVHHKILGVVEQRVTLLMVGIGVLATVSIETILRYIPTSAMLGMFLYMGVMGIRDLVVTRRLIAMFKRRKHWKDHEYLKDIPPSVMRLFEILQLLMIGLMLSMNCITEFLGVSWTTFLIPALLLVYSISRELILPRISWLEPHLEKLDPRHNIQVANLCLPRNTENSASVPEKSSVLNRPPSVNNGVSVPKTTLHSFEIKSDNDDSLDTSGDDISSYSSSEQDL